MELLAAILAGILELIGHALHFTIEAAFGIVFALWKTNDTTPQRLPFQFSLAETFGLLKLVLLFTFIAYSFVSHHEYFFVILVCVTVAASAIWLHAVKTLNHRGVRNPLRRYVTCCFTFPLGYAAALVSAASIPALIVTLVFFDTHWLMLSLIALASGVTSIFLVRFLSAWALKSPEPTPQTSA
jgi:hypothetical protein